MDLGEEMLFGKCSQMDSPPDPCAYSSEPRLALSPLPLTGHSSNSSTWSSSPQSYPTDAFYPASVNRIASPSLLPPFHFTDSKLVDDLHHLNSSRAMDSSLAAEAQEDQHSLWSTPERGRTSPVKPIPASGLAGSSAQGFMGGAGSGTRTWTTGTMNGGTTRGPGGYMSSPPLAGSYSPTDTSSAFASSTTIPLSPTTTQVPAFAASHSSSHDRSHSHSSTSSSTSSLRSPFNHAPPVLLTSPLIHQSSPSSPDSETSDYSPQFKDHRALDNDTGEASWAAMHFPSEEDDSEIANTLGSPFMTDFLKDARGSGGGGGGEEVQAPRPTGMMTSDEPVRRQPPISIRESSESTVVGDAAGAAGASWWREDGVPVAGSGLSMSISPGASSMETRNNHSPLSFDALPLSSPSQQLLHLTDNGISPSTPSTPMTEYLHQGAAFAASPPSTTVSPRTVSNPFANSNANSSSLPSSPLPPPTFQTTAPPDSIPSHVLHNSYDPPSPRSLPPPSPSQHSAAGSLSPPISDQNISPRSPSPIVFPNSTIPLSPSISPKSNPSPQFSSPVQGQAQQYLGTQSPPQPSASTSTSTSTSINHYPYSSGTTVGLGSPNPTQALIPPRSSSRSSSRTSSRGALTRDGGQMRTRERADSTSSSISRASTGVMGGGGGGGDESGSETTHDSALRSFAATLPLPDSPASLTFVSEPSPTVGTKAVPVAVESTPPPPPLPTATPITSPAPPAPAAPVDSIPVAVAAAVVPAVAAASTSPPPPPTARATLPPRREKKPPPPPLTEKSMQRRKTIGTRPSIDLPAGPLKRAEAAEVVPPVPAITVPPPMADAVLPPVAALAPAVGTLSPSSSFDSGLDKSRESVSDFADVYGQFNHLPTPLTSEFPQSALPSALRNEQATPAESTTAVPQAILHAASPSPGPDRGAFEERSPRTLTGALSPLPRSISMSNSPSKRSSILSEASVEEFHDAPMVRGLSNGDGSSSALGQPIEGIYHPGSPILAENPNRPMDAKAKAAAFVADLRRARLAANNSNPSSTPVSPATIATEFESAPSSANPSPYMQQSVDSFRTGNDDAYASAVPLSPLAKEVAGLAGPHSDVASFAVPPPALNSGREVDEDLTVQMTPQPTTILEDRNRNAPVSEIRSPASVTHSLQQHSPASTTLSLHSPHYVGQEFDLDKLSRGRFLPECVKTADVRRTKAAGDRAKLYASKINALAKENSGASVWISYVQHHYAQSVLGTPQVASSPMRSRSSREDPSSASSVAFPLRGGESFRARELSEGQFGPRDMQPNVPYPGILGSPNLRYPSKQVNALSKTGFFSLGRKGSKRASPPARAVSSPGGLTIGSPLSLGSAMSPQPGGGPRSGPRMPGEPRTSTSSGRETPTTFYSPTMPNRPVYTTMPSPAPQQVTDFSATPEMQKLSDILPYLSRDALNDALTRAGGDEVLAISIALDADQRK